MATTETTHRTLSLEEAFAEGDGPRRGASIRRELGVQSFAIAATKSLEAGPLINDRDETGPTADRHEKVWVVLSGHAVFTVDGEEVDAPAGTVVHVPDPEVQRSAVAKEPGTTLLGIGGRPGEAYRDTPGEAIHPFFALHTEKDYEGAAAVARDVLERYPANGLALFNLGCCEALLGRSDDAIAHVREALDSAPSLAENAKTDTDLDSLRDDPRFQKLIADS